VIINTWKLYYFSLFKKLLDDLEEEVEHLKVKNPDDFTNHPKFKLLKGLYKNIKQLIPENPHADKFRLGRTLGNQYTNWKRTKIYLPPRYRMFFRFSSTDHGIVYAWFNNHKTLRKDGSRTDVYRVFQQMLEKGDIPDQYDQLKDESSLPEQ